MALDIKLTQERVETILGEYQLCQRIAYDETERESVRKYYLGKAAGIKFALVISGVPVEEGEFLL